MENDVKLKDENQNLNYFSLVNQIISHTIGTVEISYKEKEIVEKQYNLGILIDSKIVLASSNNIAKIENLNPNIIFFPSDIKSVSYKNCYNNFIKLNKYSNINDNKEDFNPLDEQNYQKNWSILTSATSIGDIVYSLNGLKENYLKIGEMPIVNSNENNVYSLENDNINKENNTNGKFIQYKFFYVTYIPNFENQNNSGSHLEFITINIDVNKVFVKEDEIKNEIANYKGKSICIALSCFDENLKTAITKNESEGYLIAFQFNNKSNIPNNLNSNNFLNFTNMFICAYYNGKNLNSYESLKENFQINDKVDNNHFFLNLDEFRQIRDVNQIIKIQEHINKDYYINYGIKYFSISAFNALKSYFNSEKRLMMIVNYGESLILDLCKNMKIQIKHLDIFYIIKLIISEESYIKLKEVVIENYHPSLESFSAVIESFYMLKKLAKIKFSNCDLTPTKCSKILDLICHNLNIKDFIFCNNKLDFECFQILIDTLNILTLNNKCKDISVIFNENLLVQSQKNLIKMKTLKMNFIIKAKKLYFVKMFDSISMSHLFFEKMYKSIENYNNDIDNIQYFMSKIDQTYEYVNDKEICSCEILNLSFNIIKNSDYLISMIKNMPILCEIILNACELNNEFILNLVDALKTNPLITYLDLSNNFITGDIMTSLMVLIKIKDEFITNVIIKKDENQQEIKQSKSNSNSIGGVFKKVYNVTKLTKGNVDSSKILDSLDSYELKIILNNNLIGLNKSDNKGLIKFFKDIAINKANVSISFDNNLISAKIFQSFCQSLNRRSFKRISFRSNYLTDDIISNLSKYINNRMTLQEIDLSDNLISKRQIRSIISTSKMIFDECNYQKDFKIIIDDLAKFSFIKNKILNELENTTNALKKIEENFNYETPNEYDFESLRYHFIIDNLSFKLNEEVLNLDNDIKIKKKLENQINMDDINNPLYDMNSHHESENRNINELNVEEENALNDSYNQFDQRKIKLISYDEVFKYIILINKINK